MNPFLYKSLPESRKQFCLRLSFAFLFQADWQAVAQKKPFSHRRRFSGENGENLPVRPLDDSRRIAAVLADFPAGFLTVFRGYRHENFVPAVFAAKERFLCCKKRKILDFCRKIK